MNRKHWIIVAALIGATLALSWDFAFRGRVDSVTRAVDRAVVRAAYAVVPALRVTGVQVSSQTTCPVGSGQSGVWNNSGVWKIRNSGGSDSPIVNGTPASTGDTPYSTSGGAGMSFVSDVASGSYYRSGGVGAPPAWSTLTMPNSAAAGDLFYATATNAMGNLAAAAAGSVLTSGTPPAWSSTPSLQSLTLTAGSGTQTGFVGLTIFSSATPVSSVTTGTIDGQSFTMPANTLSANGQSLHIRCFFLHAADTNAATQNMVFGATTLSQISTSTSNDSVAVDMTVMRLTSTTAQYVSYIVGGTGFNHQNGVFTSLNFGSSIVIKNQVTGATTNGDMTAQGMRVSWVSN